MTAGTATATGTSRTKAFRSTVLTVRLHRFEVVAFTVLALLGVGLTFYIAARLDAVGYGTECIQAMRTAEVVPTGCEFKINTFYEIVSSQAGPVSALITLLPFLAALMLGVAVIGREVERGTTRLAWALTPSRLTWLAQRLVPVLLLVAGIGLVLGGAADRLLASTEPGIDTANAFEQFGSRGPVLAARAVFVFLLAVAVGAAMGRMLPALLVATVLAIAGITGGSQVHDRMLQGEAVVIGEYRVGDRTLDQRFVLPDGRLIGWEEVERYDPPPTDPNSTENWPTLPHVMIGIPRERYGEVQLREIGALAGGSLVALLFVGLVVQRRRPG